MIKTHEHAAISKRRRNRFVAVSFENSLNALQSKPLPKCRAWPAPGAHSLHQTFDSSLREWIAPSAMSAARGGDVSAAVGRRNFTMAWQRPATAPKGAAYGCQPSFSAAFTFSASEPRFGLSIILYSSTSICLSWKNAGSESSRIYCLREAVCNFTPESQRIPPRFVLSAARAVQPSGQ